MKKLVLPVLVTSALALSACCNDSKKHHDHDATEATADSTAKGAFASIFALPAFADNEEGEELGKGTLDYYDGEKVVSAQGNLHHFKYPAKEGSFSQEEFDKAVSEEMKEVGAEEFFNDVVPEEFAKELAEKKGDFQHSEYLGENIDFKETKLREFSVEKDGKKVIYQVASNAEHGEVGVFTVDADAKAEGAEDADAKAEGAEDADAKAEGAKDADAKAESAEDADAKAEGAEDADAKAEGAEDADAKDDEPVTSEKLKSELGHSDKITLKVKFDSAKATISKDNTYVVDELYKLLSEDSELKLAINGHTDSSGNAENNQKLSLERAQAVKSALEAKGIDSSRLKAEGFGSSKPLVNNDTLANRAKNRRVELVKF